MIVLGDFLVLPGVLLNCYHPKHKLFKHKSLQLDNYTTVCMWIFCTLSIVLHSLVCAGVLADPTLYGVSIGVVAAGLVATLIMATVRTYWPTGQMPRAPVKTQGSVITSTVLLWLFCTLSIVLPLLQVWGVEMDRVGYGVGIGVSGLGVLGSLIPTTIYAHGQGAGNSKEL